MNNNSHRFLSEALGRDGAEALCKAVERESSLGDVIVPRAIIGWLSTITKFDYEGQIPGVDNSYLSFKKSEDGQQFSGTLALENENYSFSNSNIVHLASAVAMAIGVDTNQGIDTEVRDAVLVKLGKSIDILAKAQLVTNALKQKRIIEKTDLPGQAHAPLAPKAPSAPLAPGSQDINVKLPKSSKTPTVPKLPKPPKAFKLPNLKVGKSEAERPCDACGGKMFKDNKFKGCICFQDIAKSIKTITFGDGYVLQMGKGIDEETMRALMDVFDNE